MFFSPNSDLLLSFYTIISNKQSETSQKKPPFVSDSDIVKISIVTTVRCPEQEI